MSTSVCLEVYHCEGSAITPAVEAFALSSIVPLLLFQSEKSSSSFGFGLLMQVDSFCKTSVFDPV